MKIILTALVIVLIISQFVMPTDVYGGSMEPGFCHNEYLLVSRQAYNQKRVPEKGDVIVFRSSLEDEAGQDKVLIKRIIAVPGDTILIKEGNVYVNGNKIDEPYLKDGTTNGEIGLTEIPENGYFCMGDNRLRSLDSRDKSVGIVSGDDIIGKVIFRFFPLGRFGKI